MYEQAFKNIENVQYLNTGDWVENKTALVEHLDGRFEIIHFKEEDFPEEEDD